MFGHGNAQRPAEYMYICVRHAGYTYTYTCLYPYKYILVMYELISAKWDSQCFRVCVETCKCTATCQTYVCTMFTTCRIYICICVFIVHISHVRTYPPAPMNHLKIFKGWPLQDAPWWLVQLWYKSFPSGRFLPGGNEEANYFLVTKAVPHGLVRRIRFLLDFWE